MTLLFSFLMLSNIFCQLKEIIDKTKCKGLRVWTDSLMTTSRVVSPCLNLLVWDHMMSTHYQRMIQSRSWLRRRLHVLDSLRMQCMSSLLLFLFVPSLFGSFQIQVISDLIIKLTRIYRFHRFRYFCWNNFHCLDLGNIKNNMQNEAIVYNFCRKVWKTCII